VKGTGVVIDCRGRCATAPQARAAWRTQQIADPEKPGYAARRHPRFAARPARR
jgi:hypothetical protein